MLRTTLAARDSVRGGVMHRARRARRAARPRGELRRPRTARRRAPIAPQPRGGAHPTRPSRRAPHRCRLRQPPLLGAPCTRPSRQRAAAHPPPTASRPGLSACRPPPAATPRHLASRAGRPTAAARVSPALQTKTPRPPCHAPEKPLRTARRCRLGRPWVAVPQLWLAATPSSAGRQ